MNNRNNQIWDNHRESSSRLERNTFIILPMLLVPVALQRTLSHDVIPVFAILGQSHTFKCNLSASGIGLQWYDNVYNTEVDETALIFGGNQEVNQAHPISQRLSVDNNGSLTISNLMPEDAGEYFCQSTVGGVTQTQRFELSLGG